MWHNESRAMAANFFRTSSGVISGLGGGGALDVMASSVQAIWPWIKTAVVVSGPRAQSASRAIHHGAGVQARGICNPLI